MLRFFFIAFLFISLLSTCRTNKSNKTYTEQYKTGIIFFSDSYAKFKNVLKTTDDIDFVFLPDIFFPVKKIDTMSSVLHNFNQLKENGIELHDVVDRERLLSAGIKYRNHPSELTCYNDSSFVLLPVKIRYKIWENHNPNMLNCEAPVILNVNGSVDSFKYSTPSNEVISIEVFRWNDSIMRLNK